MRHYLYGPNVGLVTARQNASGAADHFWVTRHPTEMKTAESTRGSLTLPLYRYPQTASAADAQLDLTAPPAPGRTTNLEPQPAALIADATGLAYHDDGTGDLRTGFGPDDVLAYAYAVLNAPAYRTRYAQQLRAEHPRVPLPPDAALFAALARHGHRLVALHTDDPDSPPDIRAVNYPLRGTDRIERLTATTKPPRWTPPGHPGPDGEPAERGRLWLQLHPRPADGPDRMPAQYVDGVSEAVWQYTVGGHQVLHKWLRAREGRVLAAPDLARLRRIVAAITETLAVQAQIEPLAADLLALAVAEPLPGPLDDE